LRNELERDVREYQRAEQQENEKLRAHVTQSSHAEMPYENAHNRAVRKKVAAASAENRAL
jgi:hypothetical protein